MKYKFLGVTLLFAMLVHFSACNRVLLHSKDKDMDPLTQVFSIGTDDALKTAKEALTVLGYKIEREESSSLKTRWESTKASSHYVDLFGHKDYGTVGAYYRLVVQIADKDGKAEVSVSAPIRSVITRRVYSANREEKKVLKKMADLIRKDDFEITNVGLSE